MLINPYQPGWMPLIHFIGLYLWHIVFVNTDNNIFFNISHEEFYPGIKQKNSPQMPAGSGKFIAQL